MLATSPEWSGLGEAYLKVVVHLIFLCLSIKLRRFQPNFVQDREKITYTEIWSLAVSPNGERVFTARDNTIMVADIGVFDKFF